MKRLALVVPVCVLAPLTLIRPVSAQSLGYASVATTALAAGIATEGTVGASGGLVILDTGTSRVAATLDGSPSAHVVAAAYEPGSTVRAVLGSAVNPNLPPAQQIHVPGAEASYPGSATASTPVVPPTSVGPVSLGGGAATAAAGPHLATGTATGAALDIAGSVDAGSSTTDVRMAVDAAGGTVTQTVRTAVSSVVVGPLHLDHVVGSARITSSGDTHTAIETLTIGGASVAGQEVKVGNDGVTAVGTTVVPGKSLSDATDEANARLKAAGIQVRTVGGRAKHDARSADADTGGVLITIVQDGVPEAGVAGNTLSVLVGGVSLTEADTAALPALPVGVSIPSGSTTTGVGPTSTSMFVPGSLGTQGTQATGPTVAPPTSQAAYEIAGRRFSARTELIAFGVWQMLTLGLPTLYAFAERKRRLATA